MFMINLFLYTHKVKEFLLSVYTVDNEKQNVKLKNEIPQLKLYNEKKREKQKVNVIVGLSYNQTNKFFILKLNS